jgi:hypothetical protein
LAVKPSTIFATRQRFALPLGIRRHEIFRHLSERPHGASGAAFFDRVRARLDRAQELLGLRAGFVRRQSAMLADGHATRAAVLAMLCDIDLAASRERGDAEAGERVIPQKAPIPSGLALERVNRPLCDPPLRQGPRLRFIPVSNR